MGFFGLPDDLNYVPLLAVVDGLDAVDAAVHYFALGRLAIGGGACLIGAPEVGDVGPGFTADVDLLLVEDHASVLGYSADPAVDIKDDGGGCTVRGDADGDEARIWREEGAKAGAVLVRRAADCGVDCGD